ncbi:MAG: ssrAB activated protein [Desulfovibrio sp.]|nr:MAG: ssrAB activated protein [Desulfovibrio sp.]
METLPQYRSIVSIIPGGCLQFLDCGFARDAVGRVRQYFREQRQDLDALPGEQSPYELISLAWDEDKQQHIDRKTGQPGAYDYEVDGLRALEVYLDAWVPLPFLRVKAERWDVDGERKYEKGPANWARGRVKRIEDPDGTVNYQITVVFDTVVEDRPPEREPYFALSPEDVSENSQFKLAWHERDNAWFLNAGWVDEWLKEVYDDHLTAKRKGRRRADESPYVLEHLAYYLAFLEMLRRADVFPVIRVIDPSQYEPIDVDLVLDLGNSRTCGILVETRPQAATNLNDSYVLQLRDLSEPDKIFKDPFETRIEFSEASFGNARLSARSGRVSEAFVWPSAVRVGPEAVRLAGTSSGSEGSTGMSSPKRYLWDEQPRIQQWHYNGSSPDGHREPPVTRGLFVQYVNKEGTPLEKFEDPLVKRNPVLRKQSREIAFEARFTRSSIMMFLLSEIILHALVTINSPAQRSEREHSDIPRRLRRVIFTVSTAMPLAEQRIYRRWAKWAVDMVWKTLGWGEWHGATRKGRGRQARADYRQSPEVRCEWDEATSTQLVYLYNELAEKYSGDAHHLFRLLGKEREGFGTGPSVRVASIDIGGGTTDLSISTFETAGDETATARIKPHLNFREGFNIAGDDVLCAVIEDHILKDVRQAFVRAGVSDPRQILGSLFGRDVVGKSLRERNLRGQFVRQVAVPVGHSVLSAYEQVDLKAENRMFSGTLGEILGPGREPGQAVIEYVERAVREAGGREFSLLDIPIRVSAASVDATVRRVLGQILADLCEVAFLYDCDLMLVTGRPSRWPAVCSALLAKLPVPPDRIVPMHEFRVGNWYPFADALGQISDPKTTVVVGAILCALAEGYLEGFSFDTSVLGLKSTARFIGEMGMDGQIKQQKVWFAIDLDNPELQEYERSVEFSGPMAIGFRQLEAERWTTTRFYLLDFAHAEARANAQGRTPYKVDLLFTVEESDEEQPNQDRDEGELHIEDIEAADGGPVFKGDLVIRLQTLPSDEGYWLDTGVFNIV